MQKYFAFVIPFFFWGFLSFAQDTSEKSSTNVRNIGEDMGYVEVELDPLSLEEFNKTRPSTIDFEDFKALLNFVGLDLVEEKLLTDLKSEKEKDKGYKRWHKDSALTLGLINETQYLEGRGFLNTAEHSIRGFPLESIIFYTAVGASMATRAYIDSIRWDGRADPRWMDNLILNITSPVGLFSFFCFVFFSNQTSTLYSKMLLNGFVFKKGPLKGYRIVKPLMPAQAVGTRLRALRQEILLSKGSRAYFSRLKRLSYRGRVKFFKSLGGRLGMGVGMLASNIVHEVEYMFGHSADFKQCVNDAIKTEDAHLACDLFWGGNWWQLRWASDIFAGQTTVGSHLRGWGPDLVSLIAASVLSHQMINTGLKTVAYGAKGVAYGAKGVAYGAKQLGALTDMSKIEEQALSRIAIETKDHSSRFIKGFNFRVSQKVPIKSLLNKGIWFIPMGMKFKGIQKTGIAVKGTFRMIKSVMSKNSVVTAQGTLARGLKRLGGWLFRGFHIYWFFEVEEFLTSKWIGDVLKDDLKANELKYSIENFSAYYDITSETPALICEEEEGCRYHPSILSLTNVRKHFVMWGDHKMKELHEIWGNWVFYAGSAVGSIEKTYETYKEFFKSREGQSTFYNKRFFFDAPLHGKVLSDFRRFMEAEIGVYFELHPYEGRPEEELSYNVVSMSPYRFLKPDINWERPDQEHLKILEALFLQAEPGKSLELFFDDYNQALMQEKQGIIQKLKQNGLYFDSFRGFNTNSDIQIIEKNRQLQDFIGNKQESINKLKASFSRHFKSWKWLAQNLREQRMCSGLGESWSLLYLLQSFTNRKECPDVKEIWLEYILTAEALHRIFSLDIHTPLLIYYRGYAGFHDLEEETTPLVVRQVREHFKLMDSYIQPVKTYLQDFEERVKDESLHRAFIRKKEVVSEFSAFFTEYFRRWEQLFESVEERMEISDLTELWSEYVFSAHALSQFFEQDIHNPVLEYYETYVGELSEADFNEETTPFVIRWLHAHLQFLNSYVQIMKDDLKKLQDGEKIDVKEKFIGWYFEQWKGRVNIEKSEGYPALIDQLFQQELIKRVLMSEEFLAYYKEAMGKSIEEILKSEKFWTTVKVMEDAPTRFDELFGKESIDRIVENRAERILREKVLASGLEYLNTLVETKVNAHWSRHNSSYVYNEAWEKKLEGELRAMEAELRVKFTKESEAEINRRLKEKLKVLEAELMAKLREALRRESGAESETETEMETGTEVEFMRGLRAAIRALEPENRRRLEEELEKGFETEFIREFKEEIRVLESEFKETLEKAFRMEVEAEFIAKLERELEAKKKKFLVPRQVRDTFYKLGTENIFARLYARTFYFFSLFPDQSPFKHEFRTQPVRPEGASEQIKPFSQGMAVIEEDNKTFKALEESGNFMHPYSVEGIPTPYFMDFIIASAICGPDLNENDKNRDYKFQQIQSVLQSTLHKEKALESTFKGLDLADMMSDVPVFGQGKFAEKFKWFEEGLSYMFYPPRIVDMDEKDRIRICQQVSGLAGSTTNIYDGHFRVGDKVYKNLLYVVLDFAGGKGLNSEKEFETWWENKVVPYYRFFVLAMDREYKNIMDNAFLKSFFQDEVRFVPMSVEWNPLKSKSYQESPVQRRDPPVGNRCMDCDINQESPVRENPLTDNICIDCGMSTEPSVSRDSLVRDFPTLEKSVLPLPEGVSHQIHFELKFWKNMLLHFARFRFESELNQLEDVLDAFIEEFKPDPFCSERADSLQKMIGYCQHYLINFLRDRKRIQELWLDIAKLLKVRQRQIDELVCIKSQNLDRCDLTPEELYERRDEFLLGGHSFDVPISNGQSLKKQSVFLHDLLVEYSVIQLYYIFDGVVLNYASVLTKGASDKVDLFEDPEFMEFNKGPNPPLEEFF